MAGLEGESRTIRLLPNLLHFGRLLRLYGIQTRARQVCDLADAFTCIDISRREDVLYAGRGLLLHDPRQLELFAAVFELFWEGCVTLPARLVSRELPSFSAPPLPL